MMPGNVLSTTPVPAPLLQPDSWNKSPYLDFEKGGVALLDTSQGLDSHIWKAWIDDGNIFVNRIDLNDDSAHYMLYAKGARYVGLAFDSNMNVAITYQQGSSVFLYWFDTSVSHYVTTEFPGCRSPGITLDDKRAGQSATSDILLFYIRLDKLYFRMQRDRYLIEYHLYDLPTRYNLTRVGMGTNYRLQFVLEPIP